MTASAPSPRPLVTVVLVVFAAAWLTLVVVPPVILLGWRDARLADVSDPGAQEEWDRFRADMRQQSGDRGPVRRKVPRSPEPPERIWLRDYPLTAAAAWVLFVGLLGVVVGLMLRGALVTGPPHAGISGRE